MTQVSFDLLLVHVFLLTGSFGALVWEVLNTPGLSRLRKRYYVGWGVLFGVAVSLLVTSVLLLVEG